MSILVQIYTAQSVSEALALADLGVDHIGLTPAARGLPGEISVDAAAEIVRALRDREAPASTAAGGPRSVALTVETSLEPVVEMARAVQPDILHFCPPAGSIGPELIRAFRQQVPGREIMYAVSVAGPEAVDEAARFAEVADWLILDTQAPDIPGVGASGAVHDWSISRRIVTESPIPVILAGGLSPENVAEAIERVLPAGVDSLTHTNVALPEGGFRKDLDRVASFVSAARAAAQGR